MGSPSLGGNAAWALAGNLVYAGCQAGVLMVLAKLTSAADVGRFALGLAVATPVMLFTNLHLRAIQATDARRAHAFGTYLGLRMLTIGAALAVIAGLALGAGHEPPTARVILAVGLAKGVEAISDVLFGRLQQAERLRRVALSLMAKGGTGLIVVAVVVAATGSVLAAVLGLAVAWGIVLLAVDLRAVGRLESLRPRFSPSALGGLTRLALPLGGVMGLNALMVSVPRFAVENTLGPAALGHFAALAYLLIAVQQPMLAVGAAVSPRLARHFVADRGAYCRLTRATIGAALALGLVMVAVAAVLGPGLLPLVYTPEYALHADVLAWLALAGAVGMSASAIGYALTAARWFAPQLAIAGIAVSVCALASHWLVPSYGLTGAAWAVLATETCRVTCLAILYRAARAASIAAPATDRGDGPSPIPLRRVLHVFGVMDRGGAETRTLEVMRRAVTRAYAFDFCVLGARAGAYAPEIARLGGRVLPCSLASRPLTFPLRLYRLIRRGAYDAVHSHLHQFSGLILLVARVAGVATRIAHVRSSHDGHRPSPARRLYRAAMRALVDHNATRVVGVSTSAMDAFWGAGWTRDRRKIVIYNGVEETFSADAGERAAVRRELGLAPEAPVVLHVGRFAPAKNHGALLAIAAALMERRPDAVLLLVGDGPLRSAIEIEIVARGLCACVRLLGTRDDVPRLLRAADVLVHPSRWEGLPGVVLEALGAGLPVVASPIPPVIEIAHHVTGVTLSDPTDALAFARAIEAALALPALPAAPRVGRLPAIFRAAHSTERLLACYQ